MKTLICLLLMLAIVFALKAFHSESLLSPVVMADSRGHGGHGGYLYPGPFPGPYYTPYPYYAPYYPYSDKCWVPGHWEQNPVNGDYYVPGHYERCY